MNKELIERLAEQAYTEQMGQTLRPQDRAAVIGTCTRFLSAYLAERGKEAASVGQFTVAYPNADSNTLNVLSVVWDVEGVTAGTHELFLAQQPAIPEGMALVPIDIHPLDGTERNGVAALLCNPPEVLRDQDPTDYYAYWWGLLVAAAGVAP